MLRMWWCARKWLWFRLSKAAKTHLSLLEDFASRPSASLRVASRAIRRYASQGSWSAAVKKTKCSCSLKKSATVKATAIKKIALQERLQIKQYYNKGYSNEKRYSKGYSVLKTLQFKTVAQNIWWKATGWNMVQFYYFHSNKRYEKSAISVKTLNSAR